MQFAQRRQQKQRQDGSTAAAEAAGGRGEAVGTAAGAASAQGLTAEEAQIDAENRAQLAHMGADEARALSSKML